jgi:hypothetical protein
MKWFIALLSLSFLASCTTKPWMVGSVNDRGCGLCKNGMGKYQQPADIATDEPAPYDSGKSGKGYRSVTP